MSCAAQKVSPRQRGNPVLQHISNVAYEFGPKDMAPDYVCGDTCCALYLSLKYHLLHSNYLAARLQSVGSSFTMSTPKPSGPAAPRTLQGATPKSEPTTSGGQQQSTRDETSTFAVSRHTTHEEHGPGRGDDRPAAFS